MDSQLSSVSGPEPDPLQGVRASDYQPSSRTLRRLLVNRLAKYVVSFGGLFIVASIVAILWVFVAETLPLFRAPTASPSTQVTIAPSLSPVRAVGTDEYRKSLLSVHEDGSVRVVMTEDGSIAVEQNLGLPPGVTVVSAESFDSSEYMVTASNGALIPVRYGINVDYNNGVKTIMPEVTIQQAIMVPLPPERPVLRASVVQHEGHLSAVLQLGPRELVTFSRRKGRGLLAAAMKTEEHRHGLASDGEISALKVNDRGDTVVIGTTEGELFTLTPESSTGPKLVNNRVPRAVTLIGVLIGGRTWIVADAAGGVSSWMFVSALDGHKALTRIHGFKPHATPVEIFARSLRNRSFITGDTSGRLALHFSTSGETLAAWQVTQSGLGSVAFAPRGNGFITQDASGSVENWELDNPHPEISLHTLFGKVWYEGYAEPAHVWQSTGGTDDFEPKLGLWPLLAGTLKGTLYALLFAVPLAVLGALYTAQFMHPRIRALVKPLVELMAALPSVVVGFIAGLWLAPRIEPVLAGVLLTPVVVPLTIVFATVLWRAAGKPRGRLFARGTEIFMLLPVVALGIYLSVSLGRSLEQALFAGNFSTWIFENLGATVDQRNSVVVGLALGFAVIPLIFTIAEDSLANVPKHLSAASFALGANSWETALRVVLPAALPGIFSAIMIGFGRAVGETMIVLMATGNTPIIDFSPFNGFRALSANIAVELPEAPEGGTLFRVLFLSALLLFTITFVLNTLTELLRLRIRKRYKQL